MTAEPGPWGQKQPPRSPARLGLYIWLGLMAATGIGLFALSRIFPDQRSSSDNLSLIQTLSFLALASSSLLALRQVKLKQAAVNVALWLAVAAVLVLGFTFQDRLLEIATRIRSELVPGYPVQVSAHEMVLSEREGGSYFVYGSVNGTQVPFLVDTGASSIVLSPNDARRLNIDLSALDFAHVYETANGEGRGAGYRVHSLKVGGLTLTDVPVSINKAEMQTSLLGMSFLRRLKSFEFRDRKLIMRF